MTTVETLRKELSDNQKNILDFVWNFYLKNREWVTDKKVHHKFKKSVVVPEIKLLGGDIISSHDSKYQLFLLGVLLTSKGRKYEKLLVKFLEYTIERFMENPDVDQLMSEEIDNALNLSKNESLLLCKLVGIGSFWGGSGGFGTDNWHCGLPSNIDELVEIDDLLEFIHYTAIKRYDPDSPIDTWARDSYKNELRTPKDLTFDFITNIELRKWLTYDWHEARIVYNNDANKSCVILCGGILEGLLLNMFLSNKEESETQYKALFPKSKKLIYQWDLDKMVILAEKMDLVNPGTIHLSNALRYHRNLVHPGRQIRENVEVTKEDANISFQTVKKLMNELNQT